MALIKCPECGGTVSDKAQACIHCGFPLAQFNQEDERLCSIVLPGRLEQVGSFTAAMALYEVGAMSLDEARFVLANPGEVILSHLTPEIAKSHAETLAAKKIPVKIVEEEPVEDSFSLVCYVRGIKFPRKALPEINAHWKKTFPEPESYFQNMTHIGMRYTWKPENEPDNIPPYSKVSIFNGSRKKIGLCHAKKIEVVPSGENIFIWVDPDTLSKGEAKSASLLVLGDVETIPTDEMSRKGVYTTADLSSPNIPTCPKCGSHSIQVIKKGFGAGKAVAGAFLLGPIGIAAGAIGSGEIQRVCANCGHKF
jgi:hypothetical protein